MISIARMVSDYWCISIQLVRSVSYSRLCSIMFENDPEYAIT